MKMRNVVMGVMLGALVSSGAWAQEPPPGPGPEPRSGHRGMMDEKIMSEAEQKAGLSKEQLEKLKALRKEFKTSQGTAHEQMKTKRDAMRQELDADQPDRKKAEAINEEILALERQMSIARMNHLFAMREIVTPEQFRTIRSMMDEKMKDRRKKFGRDHGKMGKDK